MNITVTSWQKHGIIICIPKRDGDNTPNGFRPITLLNTDYKILTRILARRLREVITEQLQHTQFCGIMNSSILDAASQVRDVIAHAESTSTPLCVLTLDFHNAFDRIAHEYLFHILQTYGIQQHFIDLLRAIYNEATASVQMKDTLVGPFPDPMSSAIRLPAEHGPLRAMSTSSPQHAGPKSTGTTDRKRGEVPPCNSIR